MGGVGPDSRHPFVIRGCHVWDAHWAVALATPGVLVDGLDVAHSDFGLWRPRYDRHAYRKMTVFQTGWAFYAESGRRPDPAAFPSPLDPVDDRPPVTVVTRVIRQPDGRLRVRGVAVDDGTIRRVEVNGQTARRPVRITLSGKWSLKANRLDRQESSPSPKMRPAIESRSRTGSISRTLIKRADHGDAFGKHQRTGCAKHSGKRLTSGLDCCEDRTDWLSSLGPLRLSILELLLMLVLQRIRTGRRFRAGLADHTGRGPIICRAGCRTKLDELW